MPYLIMCSISFVIFMFVSGYIAFFSNENTDSNLVRCLRDAEFAMFLCTLACMVWPVSLPALMLSPIYFIGRAAAQKLRKNK